MLIQFSVRNFRTFKEKATLSMVASNYDKDTREEENIIDNTQFNLRILKSAVVYGPNASGKSKFIEAFMFMKRFVISSSRESQKSDPIGVEAFMLIDTHEISGSEFEIIFLHKNSIYRYGFEVNRERVIKEWFYHKPKTKEIELFYRKGQNFDYHQRSFSKGGPLIKGDLVRNNALFLSVAAQFNEAYSVSTIEWFNNLRIISGLREEGYQTFTMGRTERPEHKKKILELLQAADLGIQDVSLEKIDPKNLPKDASRDLLELIDRGTKEGATDFISDVITTHRIYDKNRKSIGEIEFSMDDDESSGTRKFFALTGPILDSLENGLTLIVDELDSKLHPNLVCKIVALFNSRELNPNSSQLIFNTHDTNLLSSELFRRDQVWFMEKDRYGAAKMYSLSDFKSGEVRKSEAFEDNYIKGKYGATPYLGYFSEIVEHNSLGK